MNNSIEFKVERIISSDGTYSRVRLAPECFNALNPKNEPHIEPVENGVADGNIVRVFDINGVQLTSVWNSIDKSRFYVSDLDAQAHLVAPAKRNTISLAFDEKSFAAVAK